METKHIDAILACSPNHLLPQRCVEECDGAIKNWTEGWMRGDPWCRVRGENWNSFQDAITAWKEARDFWEAKL